MVGAARYRATQGYVRPRAQPRQQCRQTGLQHHEQTGPGLAGQPNQPLMQLRIQREGHMPAAIRGHRRARTVHRQLQLLRQAGQRVGPIGQLAGEQAVGVGLLAEQLVLPQRVVGILHR